MISHKMTGMKGMLAKVRAAPDVVLRVGHDLVRKHARSLISSSGDVPGLLQVTPPHSKGKRGNAAKQQGNEAITSDLLGLKGSRSKEKRTAGVFRVMPDELLQANAVISKNGTTVRLFARKDGTVYGCEKHFYKPRASNAEMYAHHQSLRRKSDGRVTNAGGATRDVGRWKFIDQMVVSRSTYLRYERWIQKRVGMLAASILAAYNGRYGPLRGVPAWISRHEHSWARGFMHEREFVDGLVVRIGINAGALNGEMQRRFNYVLDYRVRAMQRDLPHALRAATKQLQLS